jgi:small subunit ribosomal protein S8
MITDPIGDMIIRIKNAAMAGNDAVSIPHSKIKVAIATKLKQRGIIADFAVRGKNIAKTLEIDLARDEKGVYKFRDVRRVSKPGCRVYFSVDDIRAVMGGTGALVISTPKGILFGNEARSERVGGEPLFEIW